MTYIDDASRRAFTRFYAYEGTIPTLDCFRLYGMSRALHGPSYGLQIAI
mgnify:FL=1